MDAAKWIKTGITGAVVGLCIVSVASAGDQIRKQDRKKDGSCQTYLMNGEAGSAVAAVQTRKQDRKKDGSCQSYFGEGKSGLEVAANQTRQRDRKRDGSC
ncbi:MAG: hypothetical protein M0009_00560 [Deltaproteobacteria bacterium]|nr:hypothetical protein [Deltaproteobacteria bacterium]